MVDWDVIGFLCVYWIVAILSIFGLIASFIADLGTGLWYLGGFVFGCLLTWTTYQFYLRARSDAESSVRKEAASDNEISESDEMEFSASGSTTGFKFDNCASATGIDEMTSSESVPREKSRITAAIETIVASAFGIAPVVIVAHQNFAFPALAIGLGAIIVAVVLLLVNGRTYYAGGGALFCFFMAGAIQAGIFPEGYAKSPFAVLVTLGAISAIMVAVHLGIGILLQRVLAGVTGEKTALRIYDAVAAILGLIGIVWAVMNIHERAARYGGVTIGGTLGFALNFLGIELPIPWIIAEGVDAALVLYVGGILIGFHTLESIHTTWRATKATAKAGISAGRAAGQKTATTATSVHEKVRER